MFRNFHVNKYTYIFFENKSGERRNVSAFGETPVPMAKRKCLWEFVGVNKIDYTLYVIL